MISISMITEQYAAPQRGSLGRVAGTGLAAYGAYKLYQHPGVQKGLDAAKKGWQAGLAATKQPTATAATATGAGVGAVGGTTPITTTPTATPTPATPKTPTPPSGAAGPAADPTTLKDTTPPTPDPQSLIPTPGKGETHKKFGSDEGAKEWLKKKGETVTGKGTHVDATTPAAAATVPAAAGATEQQQQGMLTPSQMFKHENPIVTQHKAATPPHTTVPTTPTPDPSKISTSVKFTPPKEATSTPAEGGGVLKSVTKKVGKGNGAPNPLEDWKEANA